MENKSQMDSSAILIIAGIVLGYALGGATGALVGGVLAFIAVRFL